MGKLESQKEALRRAVNAVELTDPKLIEEREAFNARLASVATVPAPQAEAKTDKNVETPEEAALLRLKANFDRGILLIDDERTVKPKPNDITWEKIQAALLRLGGAELKEIMAMQNGGELFGVDEQGDYLFKDGGTEPVIFGFEADGKPVMVYNRDPQQMARLAQIADYYEVYKAVYGPEDQPTGYELFPNAPDYKKTGMIEAVERLNKKKFVKSADGKQWRAAWLDNGRNISLSSRARNVSFDPRDRSTYINGGYPRDRDEDRGALRLRRVRP